MFSQKSKGKEGIDRVRSIRTRVPSGKGPKALRMHSWTVVYLFCCSQLYSHLCRDSGNHELYRCKSSACLHLHGGHCRNRMNIIVFSAGTQGRKKNHGGEVYKTASYSCTQGCAQQLLSTCELSTSRHLQRKTAKLERNPSLFPVGAQGGEKEPDTQEHC